MTKRIILLAFLLLSMTSVTWAQTDTIKVSTSVDNPEHLYTLKNGFDLLMTSYTSITETEANAGKFAFYAEEGREDSYYIYSLDRKKWVSYTKAASYNTGKSFGVLLDSKDGAQPWNGVLVTVNASNFYQFTPYTTTGLADKYMNWCGGKSQYGLDNTDYTIGLWKGDASADGGSRWVVTEVHVYTYTVELEDGSVFFNGQEYINGQTIVVTGTLSPSDVTVSQKEGKFAVVNVDNEKMTVSVILLSGKTFNSIKSQPEA